MYLLFPVVSMALLLVGCTSAHISEPAGRFPGTATFLWEDRDDAEKLMREDCKGPYTVVDAQTMEGAGRVYTHAMPSLVPGGGVYATSTYSPGRIFYVVDYKCGK